MLIHTLYAQLIVDHGEWESLFHPNVLLVIAVKATPTEDSCNPNLFHFCASTRIASRCERRLVKSGQGGTNRHE